MVSNEIQQEAAGVNVCILLEEIGTDVDFDFLRDFVISDIDDLLVATARIAEIAGKLHGVNEQLRTMYVEGDNA